MLDNFTSFDPATLATPEVKPAADAVEALEGLANGYLATFKKTIDNPDLTETGKSKLVAQAEAEFNEKAEGLRGDLAARMESQQARVDKLMADARNADKPADLGPEATLEVTLAMEGFKHMKPVEFVDAYERALSDGDYIKRRAAEAVADVVLKPGTATLGRFQGLRRMRENPETPEIKAVQAALTTLGKLKALFDYVKVKTVRTQMVPFSG